MKEMPNQKWIREIHAALFEALRGYVELRSYLFVFYDHSVVAVCNENLLLLIVFLKHLEYFLRTLQRSVLMVL